MCDYLSFLISNSTKGPEVGKLYFADPFSHTGTAEALGLKHNAYCEVEWTKDEPKYLTVRHMDPKTARWHRQLILDRYPTRTALMTKAMPSKVTTDTVSYEYRVSTGLLKVKSANGSKRWYLQGKLHREDGPAVVYTNGSKYWYLHGKCHREDGPAIVYTNGSKSWYLHGKRHREDGPAIECADGSKEWYLHGKHHREDGPAIEWSGGDKEWYLHGKLHREGGPAIECADGSKEWYLHGKFLRNQG